MTDEELRDRLLALEDSKNGIDVFDSELSDELEKRYAPVSRDCEVAMCRMGREIERLRSENERHWKALEKIASCNCQVIPYGALCGKCTTCIARQALENNNG